VKGFWEKELEVLHQRMQHNIDRKRDKSEKEQADSITTEDYDVSKGEREGKLTTEIVDAYKALHNTIEELKVWDEKRNYCMYQMLTSLGKLREREVDDYRDITADFNLKEHNLIEAQCNYIDLLARVREYIGDIRELLDDGWKSTVNRYRASV
jgi:hypothetical protein